MDPIGKHYEGITRRHFLGQCKVGIGALALGALSRQNIAQAANLPVGHTHFAPKAKRVIFFHMAGSPPPWICSTTSPSSTNSTVNSAQKNYWKNASLSSKATPKSSAPPTNSANTDKAAPGSPNSCPTSVSKLMR